MKTVRNKFDTLQETSERHTPNDEYKNFVTANIEAAAKCIPAKPRGQGWVTWESIAVREKQDNINKVSLLNKKKLNKC